MWRQIKVKMIKVGENQIQFVWPDNTPISSNFNELCNHGIKFIFGAGSKMPQSANLIFFSKTVKESDKIDRHPLCKKTKRFYLEKEEAGYRLWFGFGVHTNIIFNPEIECSSVLEWLDAVSFSERKYLEISVMVENVYE
jgi:hypothetical protein